MSQPDIPRFRKRAVLMLLLLILGSQWMMLSDARQTLQGSARLSDMEMAWRAHPWYPNQSAIRRADMLTEQYKLNEAESIYRKILAQNPKSAGALNGLGKIAFYKTTSSNQNLRDQTDALYETAIQRYMSALRYQPGYIEAHVNLARIYMEQGRMEDAEERLDLAYSLAPNDGDVLLGNGEWFVRKGEYTRAMSYLHRAVIKMPGNASAHYYLAAAYAGRGQWDDAHQELMTGGAIKPDHAPIHALLGHIYEQQGNGAAAVEEYQKALAIKPEYHKVRLQLADYFQRRGDLSAALTHLKSVFDSSPPNWQLTDRIARLSVQNIQPDVAVKYYRYWLTSHPGDPAASAGLSYAKTEVARQKLRNDDLLSEGEAKRYAEQALRYNPDNFEARLLDAKLDRKIEKADKPAEQDPRMVDVALQQPSYLPSQSFLKGESLLKRYQFTQAEQAFRDASNSLPGNRDQMVFGELFLEKGLPQLAEESFRVVLSRMPENASAELGLSKATQARRQSRLLVEEARQNQKKAGQELATTQLLEALRIDARNEKAHYMLAQWYEDQDNYALAADHYYAYQQLTPNSSDHDRITSKIISLKKKMAKAALQSGGLPSGG